MDHAIIIQDFESMKIKQSHMKNEMNEIFTVHDESLTAEFSELWSLLWRCCLISLSSIHTRSPYIDSLSAGWQHHSYKGPSINDITIFQWGWVQNLRKNWWPTSWKKGDVEEGKESSSFALSWLLNKVCMCISYVNSIQEACANALRFTY